MTLDVLVVLACLVLGNPSSASPLKMAVQEHYNCPVLPVESSPLSVPQTTQAPAGNTGPYRGMGNQTTDVERWRDLVTAYFPDDVELVMCLIKWESGGNQYALNQEGSGARGLLQVMPFWATAFGYGISDLDIPDVNLTISVYVQQQQGWGAWSALSKC